ncbi:hypothetical protein M513_02908 [Trichuris suis]|uniref:Uncharacterized protein n=1 Tax=Trichuris suis TaxID=68888 RepID=A0A085MFY4_9BILA|nr:hypothetical protein M513_02908 [Trichuris suis]
MANDPTPPTMELNVSTTSFSVSVHNGEIIRICSFNEFVKSELTVIDKNASTINSCSLLILLAPLMERKSEKSRIDSIISSESTYSISVLKGRNAEALSAFPEAVHVCVCRPKSDPSPT